MSTFIVSLMTNTSVMIGRWLTLDAVLDGVLEAEGFEPEDRILPLLSWDGEQTFTGLDTRTVQERGLVFMASAMRVPGAKVALDDEGASFLATRPQTAEVTLRGGINPVQQFPDEQFPFVANSGREANKFEISRNESASWLTKRLCLNPCTVQWLAQGDADGVVEILSQAAGIGAKIAQGMGRFDPDTIRIEHIDNVSPLAGVLDEEGTLVQRPVPHHFMAASNQARGRQAIQTCRSPYWDRSGAEPAMVPITRHHDGLLSI